MNSAIKKQDEKKVDIYPHSADYSMCGFCPKSKNPGSANLKNRITLNTLFAVCLQFS